MLVDFAMGVRYPPEKILSLVLLCLGISGFFSQKAGRSDPASEDPAWGILLILASLGMDGLTGGFQVPLLLPLTFL